ncbi:hypothetical protein [Corynebacterium antarcticum]|uniref:hypothetical protein n=1 Tax=Corynebacterium antarcticum TaxID=2800405 RepID=UPI002260FFEC|nr:hypothetical protein [Corynebacterium antarcticum]MCX7540525.1 hypothetical protein [Corynebacterium antarcticum]
MRADFELRLAEWKAGRRAGGRPRWRKPEFYGEVFEQWARKAWARIVAHPDPAVRARHELSGVQVNVWDDNEHNGPRVATAYFSKSSPSSSKRYQHRVPEHWKKADESIGRNWGRAGLEIVQETVQLSEETYRLIARLLRRLKRNVRFHDSETGDYKSAPSVRRVLRPRGPVIGFERNEYSQL